MFYSGRQLLKTIFLTLPVWAMVSCQHVPQNKQPQMEKTPEDKRMNIEAVDIGSLNAEQFYHDHSILHSKVVNVDSLKVEHRDTAIGAYTVVPFDLHSEGQHGKQEMKYFPGFVYYTQDGEAFDEVTKEGVEARVEYGMTPVKPIAYFKNIRFNYADFIVDEQTKKVVGAIFSTNIHADPDFYKKSLDTVQQVLGKPAYSYRGFTNDNGGPARWPLLYDIWSIGGKMFQFHQDTEDGIGGDKVTISLLVLNEDVVDTFDSYYNTRFDIFRDYFDEGRQARFQQESMQSKRIGKKDFNNMNGEQ